MEELNSGPPKTNPSSGREEDLNPGPPDYKSSALPLGHSSKPTLLEAKLISSKYLTQVHLKISSRTLENLASHLMTKYIT